MATPFAHALLIVIVCVSIALMLLRPRGIAEVWWVGAGAFLLVALRLLPLRAAGHAVAAGSDVYLFLTGMMLLSELAQQNGVFEWASSRAVSSAGRHASRLFTLIYLIGTLITICLSNDATAVVLTPAVLSAVRKAGVDPKPHLLACAMIANAASFVLPISNPANLVVFHAGMPSLGRWLGAFLLPSIFAIAATYTVLRLHLRHALTAQIECTLEDQPLSPAGKLVLGGLGIVVAVLLTASALNLDLGLPTCVAALAITAVVCWKERRGPLPLLRAVSWSTLLLVAALFIMVSAVESIGALRYTQSALAWAAHLPAAVSALVVGTGVGLANNLVNNLPLGLLAGATLQAARVKGLLANAVLLGVDLGPNLSVTGSLATILWLLAMRKEKLNISAWEFLKVGMLAMPAAMLASIAGLLLAHAVFPR